MFRRVIPRPTAKAQEKPSPTEMWTLFGLLDGDGTIYWISATQNTPDQRMAQYRYLAKQKRTRSPQGFVELAVAFSGSAAREVKAELMEAWGLVEKPAPIPVFDGNVAEFVIQSWQEYRQQRREAMRGE